MNEFLQKIPATRVKPENKYLACRDGESQQVDRWSAGARSTAAILLASLLFGVAACDTHEKPPLPPAPSAVVSDAKIATATVPDPRIPEHKNAAPGSEPAETRGRPLELSYQPSAVDGQHQRDLDKVVYQQQALLPDMFKREKNAGKVSVSGGILTDPNEEELLDSVNGAEVSLHIKTR